MASTSVGGSTNGFSVCRPSLCDISCTTNRLVVCRPSMCDINGGCLHVAFVFEDNVNDTLSREGARDIQYAIKIKSLEKIHSKQTFVSAKVTNTKVKAG